MKIFIIMFKKIIFKIKIININKKIIKIYKLILIKFKNWSFLNKIIFYPLFKKMILIVTSKFKTLIIVNLKISKISIFKKII